MNSKTFSAKHIPIILLVFFFLDSIINAFVAIPIGAAAATMAYLVIVLSFLPSLKKLDTVDSLCLIFAVSIYILTLLKFFIYQNLKLSDYSDASFFSLFLVTPLLLKFMSRRKSEWHAKRYSFLFLFIVTALIAPSFLSFEYGAQSQQSNLGADTLDLEYLRGYHQGFFRHPHIASYFFSFLAVFFALKISQKTDLNKSIVLVCFSLFIVLYTGSRSGLYAIFFSVAISFIALHPNRLLSLSVLFLAGLIAANLRAIAPLFEGSFLYQYFTFFITASDNIERLSRVIIWSSWVQSVSHFEAIDILVGKPFSHSLNENYNRIGSGIWFHNDWLSSIYSYGVVGFFGLALAYFSLWGWLRTEMDNRLLSLTIFMMCLFLSIVNGLYYYYPLLLLYLMCCHSAKTNKEYS